MIVRNKEFRIAKFGSGYYPHVRFRWGIFRGPWRRIVKHSLSGDFAKYTELFKNPVEYGKAVELVYEYLLEEHAITHFECIYNF